MANEIEELKKQLAAEKAARGTMEAQLATLTQLAQAKSEPERIAALEKAAYAAKRKAVKDKAIEVAKEGKVDAKVTTVKYVTGSWYQRNGRNYEPGTVLAIPVEEEPALDWEAYERPVITRPDNSVEPEAIPVGEPKAPKTAIADILKHEAKVGRQISAPSPFRGARPSDEDVG